MPVRRGSRWRCCSSARGSSASCSRTRTREYVEQRVRAGLLEQNTVELLRRPRRRRAPGARGLGTTASTCAARDAPSTSTITELTGRHITIYGQQEVVKDLIAALLERGGELRFEVVRRQRRRHRGRPAGDHVSRRRRRHELECDFDRRLRRLSRDLPRRRSRPRTLTEYEYDVPVRLARDPRRGAAGDRRADLRLARARVRAVLDALAEDQPPVHPGARRRGASRTGPTSGSGRSCRSGSRARAGASTRARSSRRASRRCARSCASRCSTAGCSSPATPPTSSRRPAPRASTWRSTTSACSPRRSCELVPRAARRAGLEGYTETALRRVWRAQDFSNYMTQLLHDLGGGPFERRLQLARLEYLRRSDGGRAAASPRTTPACRPTPDF